MNRSKKLRFTPKQLAATALAAIGFCSVFAQAGWFGWDAAKTSTASSFAPSFALKNLSGAIVHPSDFRGQPVLIDFWASWCSSCKTALPFYQSLYLEHRAQGLVVLGVDEDNASTTAAQAAKSEGVSYPVLLDPRGKALYAYGVRGLPTAVLLDRAGRIRGRWFGFNPADAAAMKSKISKLFVEKPWPVGAPRP